MIDYAPDGRPGHVSLAESGLSGGCLEAARALLLSVLAAPGDIAPSIFVVVPLAPDVLSCGDEDPGPHARPSARGPAIVGDRIKEPKKIVNVFPIYPEAAKRQGVQGVVILEATISTSGCIRELTVLQGVRMLNAAALTAVMRWRYTPTLLDGEPVPVIMTITVTYRLSSRPFAARSRLGIELFPGRVLHGHDIILLAERLQSASIICESGPIRTR
jgi:TonB family protein